MLDPARDHRTYSFPLSDGVGNRIHRYGSWEATNYGFWASKQLDVDESGIRSLPLWTTTPPRSPQREKNHNESLSPASRTQAIARGQREMMEMVRNMPESSYELSLRDLVEKPRVEEGGENEIVERNLINKSVYRREGSISSGRKVDQTALKRSGNVYGGGFYLKMIFPTSLGSKKKKKKKKKSESSGNESWKGSVRPSVSEGSLKGGVDEDWWKKSPSASTVESESGGTSVNSGSNKSSGSSCSSSSSSRSNSRRKRSAGSCWFLIGKPKSRTLD